MSQSLEGLDVFHLLPPKVVAERTGTEWLLDFVLQGLVNPKEGEGCDFIFRGVKCCPRGFCPQVMRVEVED